MAEPQQCMPSGPPPPQRRKRKNSALDSPQHVQIGNEDSRAQRQARTPSRRSKKVRFTDSVVPVDTNPLATGITPHLRRSSLGTPRRNRQGTPAAAVSNEEVQFTPLRQLLDDRVKRRIRRNGLSEEMNEYDSDRKTNTALQKKIKEMEAELKKLRAAGAATKRSDGLSDQYCIPPASQVRVDEVEAELEALRQSFAMESAEPVPSWNHIKIGARGPSSEGGDTIQIYEDQDADQQINTTIDADSMAMGLELEAARQAKKSFLGSFRESNSFVEMNFADSPARRQHKAVGTSPRTPRTFYHDLSKQLKSTTNRAEEAELALKTLEIELIALGFGRQDADGLEVVSVIADHFRQARLDLERTMPGETVIGFENARVLPELVSKLGSLLTQLRNKETDLKAAKDQQQNLKGNFEKAIVAAEKATGRVRDLESSIDATAEEMLNLRIRSQNLEKDLAEREKDIKTLTTALEKYRSDVSRLEGLISALEASHASNSAQNQISELEAKVEAETRGRRAAENSAVARLAKISELESAMSKALSHSEKVEEAIAKLQNHVDESNKTHADEVEGMTSRINNLSNALTCANAEVEKLKITKTRLEERVRLEIESGAKAVEMMQNDVFKSVVKINETKKSYKRSAKVRSANWEIESDGLSSDAVEPMTPASIVRFSEFSEEFYDNDREDAIPSSVEIGRGQSYRERARSADRRKGLPNRSRKSRDSGIGMSPVSELEEAFFDDSGIMTPDLSSDADLDIDDVNEMSVEVAL